MTLPVFHNHTPNAPWHVTDEPAHIIDSNGYIRLTYKPKKDSPSSVTIAGFTETTNSSPGINEFYIDYQDQTQYRTASQLVKFNISQANNSVVVNYWGVGQKLFAEDLNKIKEHVESVDIHVTADEKKKVADSSVVASSTTNGNIKINGTETTVYKLPDVTADPATTTAYLLTGSVTQFFSWITKRFLESTGYAWGVAMPFSLKALAEQADIGTLYIPAGGTFSPITRAGRNKTYNKLFVDCHGENPTSLVVTLFHNATLIYTSPAITVNETIAIVNLTITGEQTVQAFVSNTTGLTKGISVSLKQVNR